MGLGGKALAMQCVWRGILHINPVWGRSAAGLHRWCRKRHDASRGTTVTSLAVRDQVFGGRHRSLRQQSAADALGALCLVSQPMSARWQRDRAWHGLGGQVMPYAGVRWIPSGVGAAPTLGAPVQRRALHTSNLDHGVNPALTASVPKTAGSGLSTARRCGRVRPCPSMARKSVR